MATYPLLINRSTDVVFLCMGFWRSVNLKIFRVSNLFLASSLLWTNLKQEVLDKEPKNPLSFGCKAEQKSWFLYSLQVYFWSLNLQFVFPVEKIRVYSCSKIWLSSYWWYFSQLIDSPNWVPMDYFRETCSLLYSWLMARKIQITIEKVWFSQAFLEYLCSL